MRKTAILAVMVGMLAGCTTLKEHEIDAAHARVNECLDSVPNDHRIKTLKQKGVALSLENLTVSHFSDQSYATEAEQDELLAFSERTNECWHMDTFYNRIYYPDSLPVYQNYIIRRNNMLTALYNRKITYGQYAKLWQKAVTHYWSELGVQAENIQSAKILVSGRPGLLPNFDTQMVLEDEMRRRSGLGSSILCIKDEDFVYCN